VQKPTWRRSQRNDAASDRDEQTQANEDYMTKIAMLMIGCAGIAVGPGCVADSPSADVERTEVAEAEVAEAEVAEAEVAESPEAAAPDAIGQFHLIRLSNTQLCLQPRGGTPGDAPVELQSCNPTAPAQNWLFVQKSSDWQVVNQQSGKCLYVNGGSSSNVQIAHADCNAFGTNNPVSNALWRPSSLTGFASLRSRIGHRDSKLCVDSFGNAFPGIGLRTFTCNGTPQQTFFVGLE
jgi:hypothetical protein